MKQTEIRMNLDGLEDIKKKLGNQYRARVGVIGSKAAEIHKGSAIDNATLGLIQLFGSITRKIPPRDWLVFPIEKNKRELIHDLESGPMRTAFERGDYKGMVRLLGIAGESYVQEGFATHGYGAWAPNAPSTIRQKGSSAPLIDQGEFRQSVTSDVVAASAAKA